LKVHVQPDLDKIQQLASLLKVSVNIPGLDVAPTSNQSIKLTGMSDTTGVNKKLLRTGPMEDVRAKYARKLKGGLAGIELAKSEVQDTMTRGDAKGLVSARKIVEASSATGEQQSQQGGSGATRWIAMSGTGKLLAYLTHRAIKIALLPDPTWAGSTALHKPMYDLTQQLPEVMIDAVLDVSSSPSYRAGKDDTNTTAAALAKQLVQDLELVPPSILVVSDRDDYLRAARDLGMMTCRLQRPNTRRGYVTALYTSESIQEVQEVVNQINGISFNAVLNL
jgi:hypothetical protein